MNQYTINYIKNNPLIYNYLREKPEWYKELNRDGSSIKIVEALAKKHYHQTPEDKIKKISQTITMINNFLDVLK